MDVKIKCDEGNFKMRVSGLIIKNGKLLTVDICENNFYCLPGGHVHLGEESDIVFRYITCPICGAKVEVEYRLIPTEMRKLV